MNNSLRLVLASGSPRRSDLLLAHGYSFDVIPADVEESSDPTLSPAELVRHNALLKARAVASLYPDRIILAADTVVSFQGRVFGKPKDMDEAVRMLTELNNEEHEVYSGVCLASESPTQEIVFVETTKVRFKNLSSDERLTYLNRIAPLDKAGAYAAQDDQNEIISSISGSLTNVIGLPMESLQTALQRFVRSASKTL